MGGPVATRRRKRRRFSDEYRAKVVQLVENSDKVEVVAEQCDLEHECGVHYLADAARRELARLLLTGLVAFPVLGRAAGLDPVVADAAGFGPPALLKV